MSTQAVESPQDLANRYREGGFADVLAHNEAQWQRYAIWGRSLAGVEAPELGTTIAGRRWRGPVVVAATAAHGLWHPHGELETARGARQSEHLFSLSQASTFAPSQVAAISGPYLQQLYLPQRRELAEPFIEQVLELGAIALILTVDQVPVPRQQYFRAQVANPATWRPYDDSLAGSEPARSLTAADISWLVERCPVPVFVKGILHPHDADRAIESGAGAVIVSNHGGRQYPGAVTPAEVLAEVVDGVAGRVPVYVDSGVRGPADVFRALCLGASAAFVGRPILRALADGGAAAVATWLDDLRTELESLFVLAGVDGVRACHRDLLRGRGASVDGSTVGSGR